MVDWKLSAGAILGVLLSVLLAHVLTKRREQEKYYLQEVAIFKDSFVWFIKALENPDANPALMVTQNFNEQDELARKLILKIPPKKAKNFKAKWQVYQHLYHEKKSQGLSAVFATEVDDISKADFSKSCAEKYVYGQTAIRRNEIINIVNEALDTL